MEIEHFENEISAICVNAISFPDGVKTAHEKLHFRVPYDAQRGYYGISFSDGKGDITYKAAAGELESGKFQKLGLDSFVIRKGNYLCESVNDLSQHIAH